MITADRSWGRYRPISSDRRALVIHFLKNCPEMTFAVIAERVSVSKTTVFEINRSTGTRKAAPKEEPN